MKIRDGYKLIYEMDGSATAVYFGVDSSRRQGFVKLNELGIFLWKKLAEECTVYELTCAVTSVYDVDEKTAAEDVAEFVQMLINDNLLEDVTRFFIVDPDKNVVFLFIPKVAGSSIKAAMYKNVYPDDYSVHSPSEDETIKKAACLTEEEKTWDSFAFVRNPFDRLVSAYESKYHNDKKMGYYNNSMSYYLGGYFAEDVGFEAFSRRICQIPDNKLDVHFVPQYMFTHYPNGKPAVKYIGRYETIKEEFPAIAEKYGYRQLPHYNSSGGDKRDWRTYYNLETAELVHEKYKKDFETFGYEDSYRELMDFLHFFHKDISAL